MHSHILLIDDDYIFRLLTLKMFERLGIPSFRVQECEDGEIGIKAIDKLTNSNEKVIVFLDINMPVLDGWGFLDRLKYNKYYKTENIAIFIVSSSTDESDIIKAKSYNIVHQFIHKPIDLNTIKKLLR